MNNQKQFGIWMDSHHAAVVGKSKEDGELTVLAHVNGEILTPNTNEKNENNEEITIQAKFFKEIASHLTNATHVHITGSGQAQEQFMHYLADTPQFKNTITEDSTSNKMSDENLVEYITSKF